MGGTDAGNRQVSDHGQKAPGAPNVATMTNGLGRTDGERKCRVKVYSTRKKASVKKKFLCEKDQRL